VARSTERQLSNPARRHFLAASGAMAGRVAAVAVLASAALSLSAVSSPAKAGGGGGPAGGVGHGGGSGRPNCFVKGTRILTPQGEARIEDLRIGDLVATVRGEALPIKWLGRNTYKKSGPAWPKSVIPIRLSRFAIDENTPHTDLYLSPGHALFIDGSLIPVKYLVNGTSVVPAMPPGMETIEYFQIVFDTHEVIWAEGVPAETFVANDKAAYEVFTNFVEYERLYPTDSYAIAPLVPELNTGGRAHLRALLSVGLSYFIDVHNPLDDADDTYDRIAARAEELELVA
jgi:hypothetical protein